MTAAEAMAYAKKIRANMARQGANGWLQSDHALVALLEEVEFRDERCSLEDFHRMREEILRLNEELSAIQRAA